MSPMSLTPSSSSQEHSLRMRLAYFSNEFPPDSLSSICRRLHVRSKDRRYQILARFLQDATLAIREEVRQLPPALKGLIPPFDSVLTFVEHPDLRRGPLGGSIDGVLLCAVQLGTFIGYFEEFSDRYDFDSSHTYLAGLGIGLLATAAVSLSPTLSDVACAGAEVARIAFRLGLLVTDVSQNLQPPDVASGGAPDSWAYVMPNVAPDDVQQELDAIHAREKTPEASKIFLSALNRTSVTVSGPPSRLKSLFHMSEFFRDRKFIPLPVFGGLCHAKHLYNKDHVRAVVHTKSLDTLDANMVPRTPVFSSRTGDTFAADTAAELLEQIVLEILTEPIQWDDVIQGIIERVNMLAFSGCQALVFRMSLPIHDLIAATKLEIPGFQNTTEDLMSWIWQTPHGESTPRGTAQAKIAIVGMSCRLPGEATDTEKFWQVLEKGLDVHRKIPADRFDVDTHYDPAGKRVNASHTPYGCFIEEPGLFDAPFFNMSPREAQQTDPMQRLALVTAYEALERAGYVPNRTLATNKHRIGTFYGQASDDYREVNTAQDVSTYFITGGCRAFGPGRINYFFKFWGPSYSIDTACSSSLATIETACASLWNGATDTAVVGGVNVLTNSDAFAGLSHGHFLSKTPNACKTWDCEADGYCRADGVVSLVMKRLEDAEADNDNILGVILGAATNHSADAISITHPDAEAQAYLLRQVLRSSGVDPFDVSYVELHGTGTQAGDYEEMKSVTDVFAPATAGKSRSPKQPVYVGAVKANVGHGEAVAGVTALLKVLMMFQKGVVPPHVGIKNTINPQIPKDLDKRNLHIPYESQPWAHVPGKKRIAVVNNFSAAGGNTSLVIEEGPVRNVANNASDPRPSHLVGVSAKSKVSLKGNLERFLAYLADNPDVSLSYLSYTTMARRHHHNHRMAVAVSDCEQLKKQLSAWTQSVDSHTPIPPTGPPPVAFAFTGQGASDKSMSLDLFDVPYFRSQVLHLDSIARGQGFPSFIPAIDGSCHKDKAHSAVVTQLALVATQISLAKYWASLGVKPEVVVGHSLGEFAALHTAGVLSASDAMFLAGQRARMLERKCEIGSHKMLAVRASVAQIEESIGECGRPYEIACVNGPRETVLSGTREEMDAAMERLTADGYKCSSLDVAFAFHSPQMEPILDEYEETARKVVYHEPSLPVISPLLGKIIFDDKTINASYMRRATREMVNFRAALEMAHKISTVDDTTVWVEIGPHPVCMSFVKSTLPSTAVTVPSLRRGENSWATMTRSLGVVHCAGLDVDWNEFHRPFEHCLRLLDLPTYSWNNKNYWIQYNGNWALTKGNTFYDSDKNTLDTASALPSGPRTSTVQSIVEEVLEGPAARVVMQSDIMQPELLAAVHGHGMNGCGVVTSSIHADIGFTLGKYIYGRLCPGCTVPAMNMTDLEVVKGLVAHKNTSQPQLFQVAATTADIHSGMVELEWRNVHADGTVDDPFASARIYYGNAEEWLASWRPAVHLIQGRIQALEGLAEEGIANRFSHRMAYTLFANSLVNYSDKYRGMQSVVMHELEAFADVTLTLTTEGAGATGTWTVPPHFIDSVAHLAGFVMNVSDAVDNQTNFCVTPGWSSMRFARPLVAGAKYRSYVKMIPTVEDTSIYLGDVYILHEDTIIGMVGGIKFRRYPRLLLNRFFSAADDGASRQGQVTVAKAPAVEHNPSTTAAASVPAPAADPVVSKPPPPPVVNGNNAALDNTSTAAKALMLVAKEAGMDVAELVDGASFANLGVDSLMSLVIAEKFREELGVTVTGSLFLEYPTVGDLKSWLLEYYS